MPVILIIDDEKNIRSGLRSLLEDENYEVLEAPDGETGLKILKTAPVDAVISDLRLPGIGGEQVVETVHKTYPAVPVIVLTGHGSVDAAVDCMRKGAYDFLTKPLNFDRLLLLIERSLDNRRLLTKQEELTKELERFRKQNRFEKLIGQSAPMRHIMEIIEQVAPTKASVLITGESGVGKELVAQAIHALSDRSRKEMISVHCAALSESLLESELFGHEEGAFTGAVSKRKGRFELADGGTLFLDEIGEINQSIQIKILRVLQERSFERVGGEKTIHTDVRLIAATNRDLPEEIKKGNFREDLYYRLNVVSIHVPPLRERADDIPLLALSFLRELSRENGKKIDGFDKKALSALCRYRWPGNVRELRNAVESAVVFCKGAAVSLSDLPPQIQGESAGESGVVIPPGTSLADAEKEVILYTLSQCGGNKSKAAEVLRIGRKTLHRKLAEYGIGGAET